MLEPLITIIVIGFVTGFIFSIPVAGPINIIITSNALKGNLRFCIRTALGGAIIEFVYVLIIVFGISSLLPYYKPFIPYLLLTGAVILVFIGIKVIKSDLEIEDEEDKIKKELRNKGGFRTGIIINLTNPSLFLGWLTSTFIVFSFASSIGLNTGGLKFMISENVSTIEEITGGDIEKLEEFYADSLSQNDGSPKTMRKIGENGEELTPILLGIFYGFSVAVGGFLWLYLYSKLIVKHRTKLNLALLNRIIQALGVILCLLALYLAFKAFQILDFF